MKIGVFDSGVGGLSVANAIEAATPEHEVLFRHDTPEHFPYATKSPDEIFGYVEPILRSLVDDGCAVIVVACNTVSTTLIGKLRDVISIPLIAVEPMVKPAAEQTKSGIITVCATPTTLASARYDQLKHDYAQQCKVLEPDCSDWSTLIERDEITEEHIRRCIEPGLQQGSDIIVLGCTHYHWIEDEIRDIVGDKATVIQPEEAIIAQLKRVLAPLV